MRDRLETSFRRTLPRWQQSSERHAKLATYYAWLDNTIYDHLRYEYNEEFKNGAFGDIYIPQQERKPSTRLNAAATAAKNVSRKLFAGRHAPSLMLEGGPEKIKSINKLLKSALIYSEMIGLVKDASVGSGCMTFKFVTPEGDKAPSLVLQSYRVIDCTPEFDIAKHLKKLTINYLVDGRWYLDQGYTKDAEENDIEEKQKYWYLKVFDKEKEFFYQPILSNSWNPVNGPANLLKEIAEGSLAPVAHGLGFVPAHWFINLAGGIWPDGACLFDLGLDNASVYDYELSQTDLGIKNSVCPITVVVGDLQTFRGEDGQPIPKTPSRHMQFAAGMKNDGLDQKSGEAYYLESNGMSFTAALEVCARIKKDLNEQMSASRKDPDKVTTAMSGKGIELIEEEFMDLVFELRTNYGDNGFLELVRKILRAGLKANHPMLKGLTESDIENLELEWPDMHDMTPQEFQQTVTGLQQGYEAGLISLPQGQDTYRAKIDVAQHGKAPKKPPVIPSATKSKTNKSKGK